MHLDTPSLPPGATRPERARLARPSLRLEPSPSISLRPRDLDRRERASLLRLARAPAFFVRGAWRGPSGNGGGRQPFLTRPLARLMGMQLATIADLPDGKGIVVTPLGLEFAERLQPSPLAGEGVVSLCETTDEGYAKR